MGGIQEYTPASGWLTERSADVWLVLYDGKIVSSHDGQWLWDEPMPEINQYFVCGEFNGKSVGVVDLEQPPVNGQLILIRQLLTEESEQTFALLSHAVQVLHCRKEHQFCSRCGSATKPKAGEWSQQCQSCQTLFYPVISPCVIVVIKRQDNVLLVRHQRHGKESTMFTLVAGFVEPGESAEQAVVREVYEETGLKVNNVQYQFSQSWPFPHSLMLGFHADYVSGELVLEQAELCDGAWFPIDELPELPPKFTISRLLVDSLTD